MMMAGLSVGWWFEGAVIEARLVSMSLLCRSNRCAIDVTLGMCYHSREHIALHAESVV